MALTNAEKVRAYRERQKALREAQLRQPDGVTYAEIFRTPYFEWSGGDWGGDVDLTLDIAGMAPPPLTDDSDPKSLSGQVEQIFVDAGNVEDSPYVHGGGSLARAELMVGCLISAAVELAGAVNAYKQSEIKARIAEIEQSDLSDPAAKRKALADVVRLQRMLDLLAKEVRWTFPRWKVDGGS